MVILCSTSNKKKSTGFRKKDYIWQAYTKCVQNKKTKNPKNIRLKLGTRQVYTLFQFLLRIILVSLINKTRERSKRCINKKEIRLSLFADGRILYLKDPNDSTS